MLDDNLLDNKVNDISNTASDALKILNKLQKQIEDINTTNPRLEELITVPKSYSIQTIVDRIEKITGMKEELTKAKNSQINSASINIGDLVETRSVNVNKHTGLATYQEVNQSSKETVRGVFRVIDKIGYKFVLAAVHGRSEILFATEEQILLFFKILNDDSEKTIKLKKEGWFKVELIISGINPKCGALSLVSAKLFQDPCKERYKSDEDFDVYNYISSTWGVLRTQNEILGDTITLYFQGELLQRYSSIVLDFLNAKIGFSNKGDYFKYNGKITFFTKNTTPSRAFNCEAKNRILHILSKEQLIHPILSQSV